jgi:predicted dehydrogenase
VIIVDALVPDPDTIRLAMVGMVEGNGHPYSWSAIFNGYDRDAMAECPYETIPEYLGKQPEETVGIAGAEVTHIWTDDPDDAEHVAAAARIPNVVGEPTDVIGEVDAVIIPTDRGEEHAARCRPFVEAGLPVFVDKPLVDSEGDLRTFNTWVESGKPIMSSSAMRYAKEFTPYRVSTANLGDLRYVSITTAKSWERYGIHALEAIYPITGPGYLSAHNTGDSQRNVVHFTHRRGLDVVVVASADMYGAYGCLTIGGTDGHATATFSDTYYAFKTQLEKFVACLRSGRRPFPHSETAELMQMLIAGIRSREQGRAVGLEEIAAGM